ncbi:MAG: NAD-dependent epimerase/dehydratase family protein, partial [Nanoarchaeota archaeon]
MEDNKLLSGHNILIAGGATVRGLKISKFLQRKGYAVFGVDRYQPSDLYVKKFFRMDMRHIDNMALIMTIVKPTVLVFCPETVTPTYNSYLSFSGVLGAAT